MSDSRVFEAFRNLNNNARSFLDNVVDDFVGVGDLFGGTLAPGAPAAPNPRPPPPAPSTSYLPPNYTPPASIKAIRQLPTIRVAPEDLIEPTNRECCICLEENSLGSMVTRLLCAHIYHQACIVDWLSHHHCTCPVCRYELETDSIQFEVGRQARMRQRKPRFARHELDRLSISSLLELARAHKRQRRPWTSTSTTSSSLQNMEKPQLIQSLIESECIILIPAPPPVVYSLDYLKKLRPSGLKKVMEEAGVFFHDKDVVEKSDLLAIFQNSGRLILLQDDDDEEEHPPSSLPPTFDMEQTVATGVSSNEQKIAEKPSLPQHVVETVHECDSDSDNNNNNCDDVDKPAAVAYPREDVVDMFGSHPMKHHVESTTVDSYPPASQPIEGTDATSRSHHGNETTNQMPPTDDFAVEEPPAEQQQTDETHENVASGSPMSLDSPCSNDHDSVVSQPDEKYGPVPTSPVAHLTSRRVAQDTQWTSNIVHSDASTTDATCIDGSSPLEKLTIAELQVLAKEAGIDLSLCFERREMIDLLTSAGVRGEDRPTDILMARFSHWSVSQLRALASICDMDMSQCTEREEMLQVLVQQAVRERPHLLSYLKALSPLATSSLKQLRGTAREWQVDISDCLEKEEILERLISKAKEFGVC